MLPGSSWVKEQSAPSIRKSFAPPLARTKLNDAVVRFRQQGLRLIGTSSHKGVPVDQAKLDWPLVIFIGSEGAGLPRDLVSQMDELVVIPHSTRVESLNAGVAASIVLYEAARKRA